MELGDITQKIAYFSEFWPDINPDELLIGLICHDSLIVHFLYLRDHFIYGLSLEAIYNSTKIRMPTWADHSTVDLISGKAISEISANGVEIRIDQSSRNSYNLTSLVQ